MLNLRNVRDDDLLRELARLVRQSRVVEAEVVAHIGEAERRRLYAREACSSMFDYCRRVLLLRENEAYLRITVARAARDYPVIIEMLHDGRLHLSGIARLAPHLTRENAEGILERASGMSYRDVRELVAELEPRPDVAAAIRKLPDRLARGGVSSLQLGAHRVESDSIKLESEASLPDPAHAVNPPAFPVLTPVGESMAHVLARAAIVEPKASVLARPGVAEPTASAPNRPTVVEPIAPARYMVRFTASVELRDKLERLQALMRSSVPDGDLARIIDVAVSEKLERIEAKRFGQTKAPRSDPADADTSRSSRHIPAAVRRFVYERDGGRCAYRDKHGRRCDKRHDLEFHHKRPFALGGDHGDENLALMCRTHNILLAEQDYGEAVMARFRGAASRADVPVDAREGRIVVPRRLASG